MKLYVIRHAATQMNKDSVINGQIDEPLSTEGIAQLPEIVHRMHGVYIEHIFASPLQRAVMTASPIAKDHDCQIAIDARLMEINPGSFAGQPYMSTIPVFGRNSSEVLSTYQYDFSPYGGETSDAVRARVQAFLDDLKKTEHTSILVVTHGGIIRWITYLITGKKSQGHANGSILEFTL